MKNVKNKINLKIIVYCLVASAAILTGCKSKQNLVQQKSPNVLTKKTINQVLEQQPTFLSLQASKITATIALGERQISAGGAVNMITDSAIILSVQPLFGIELFRVELTPQHITIVDKLNRRYAQYSYNQIIKATNTPVSYTNLQALACNQLFAIGLEADAIKRQQMDIQKTDKQYHLHFTNSDIEHRFAINNNQHRIEQVELSQTGTTDLLAVNYDNLQLTDQVAFPRQVVIKIQHDNQIVQCQLNLLKLAFNGSVNVQPADLKKYQQTTIEALIKK